MRTQEFTRCLETLVPYPFSVRQNFIMFTRNGRTFLIDAYDGELYSHPALPDEHMLQSIYRKQCNDCFYYSSPEAPINCMHYIKEGFFTRCAFAW